MLTITRVVLFQHGVGFFNRSGFVDGNQEINLMFKIDQMNDLLKSLTTIDRDGGTFSVLNYESEDPIEKRLEEMSIDIPVKGAFSKFLGRLKGAEVLIPQPSGGIKGIIVGVEKVSQKVNGVTTEEPHLVVLADKTRLVRISLLSADEVKFIDETISQDINKILGIFNSSLHKNQKKLTIHANGKGKRHIDISYVIEVPVWKTSYRMILPDQDGERPLLQGWALVDNTTEDDWQNVKLSLVSGMPVSFMHDLYTPRYKKRPEILVDTEPEVNPTILERAEFVEDLEERPGKLNESINLDMRLENISSMREDSEDYNSSRRKSKDRLLEMKRREQNELRREQIRNSIDVLAQGKEFGDLFSYDIEHTVDVKRGYSALVPILQSEAESEPLLIYNPESRRNNPMSAVRFKNTTGLTLEKGPVTVIDAGCYAGEAMLDYMKKDDESIIPYSVELRVSIKSDTTAEQKKYLKVRKDGNYIYKDYSKILKTKYKINTTIGKRALLLLDHAFQHDSGDNADPKPYEVTKNYWRYKIELPESGGINFEVDEVLERQESIEVPNIALEEIEQMHSNKLISASTRKKLENIADTAKKLNSLRNKIYKEKGKIKKIGEGQTRIRENVKALGNTKEEAKLRSKYVKKLKADEEAIENCELNTGQFTEQLEIDKGILKQLVEKLVI